MPYDNTPAVTVPGLAVLLHLVDRAERGTLLAPEAVQLRAGLRAWATELTQARRTVGGLTAEIRRLRGQGAAVSPADAPEAPKPRRSAAGASGGDVAGFNGGAGASSRSGDSPSDPRKAEAGPGGTSRGLAAVAGPSLPPGP